MARARSQVELSLFPFLNILFSLIGVLILYIFMVLVMGRAGGRAVAREGLIRDRAEAQGLDQLRRDEADLKARLEEKARALRRAEAEREQLTALLDLRRRQGAVAAAGTGTRGVPVGAPVPKRLRRVKADRRSGDNLKAPILVEVTDDRYIVHQFDRDGAGRKQPYPSIGAPALPGAPPPKAGPAPRRPADAPPDAFNDPPPDPSLAAFLEGVYRTRRDRYLLFLIRPEGIDGFKRILRYIGRTYEPKPDRDGRVKSADRLDIGHEPFSEDWIVVGLE